MHRIDQDGASTEEVAANPWTGKPFSQNYYKLLKDRKKLPVYEFKDEVIETVRTNRVTIIEGSTGSGKTTQIPQFLLEADIVDSKFQVVCTQPRRVAAINVATRVADEMDVHLGGTVGYNVRFDVRESEETRLKYVTDGLLIKQFITDPEVRQYGIIIIDEAHERSVNSDIILGLLKNLVEKRDDLHVVVMSATLEATRFIEFFNDAPHLVVPGRLHPIEIIHVDEPVKEYFESTITTALKIHNEEPPGDILIFLTGEEEIENACERLRQGARNTKSGLRAQVLPLYGSLPAGDQQRVFAPTKPGFRKIICATNIAETSVTIDGVVYVVDPGFVKQSKYLPNRRLAALLVVPISQAAATQRSGRAGRTKPGKCFRLYTKNDYEQLLPKQTTPEIQRSDLTSVILTMLATGIRDIVNFPFIDPPPQTQLATSVEELYHLGAIDDDAQLTEVGRLISIIPTEPKLAKALVGARKFGCTEEMATIVALLSEQGNAFVRPRKEEGLADAAHGQFKNAWGDHVTLINVYDAYKMNGASKQWCQNNYIDHRFISRADRSRGQLISLMKHQNIPIVSIGREHRDRERVILRALLEGMFMQVAMLNMSSGMYLLVTDQKEASIHPSSCLRRKPEWVIYNEYIFTKKDFLTGVSEVRPEWLFEASPSFFDVDNLREGLVKKALISVKKHMEEDGKFK